MPSTSSRTTRSSTAIRFPSIKNAVATTPKSSSCSKPDAITLLFRREVQSLLSTPPSLPSHIPANTPVEVVACVERLSLSGIQQSVQLCQAGEETWVTRTEGPRQYFPRAGRVQKRLRGNGDDDDEGDNEQTGGANEMEVESPIRRKKSKKHQSRQPGPEIETPRNEGVADSSTLRRNALDAPHKKKKHHRSSRSKASVDQVSDGGASTETEQSYLARTRRTQSPAMLTSIGEEGEDGAPLGRGRRRCAGRLTPQAESEGSFKVKHEEGDDLASLCGRVGGLEFRSTVDPGTSSLLS